MTFHSLAVLLSVAFLATGCLGRATFDRALDVRSIQDLPGPGDVVLIEVEHVQGLSQGFHALTLPADWKTRPVEEQAEGFPILVPPVTPVWKPVALEGSKLSAPAAAVGGVAIPWQFVRGDLTVEQASDVAASRMDQGQDTYWIGAVWESGDPAMWTCELLGARAKEDGGIQWVHLGQLEFQDSRTASERNWSRTRDSLIAGTLMFVVYIAIPTVVWWAILD